MKRNEILAACLMLCALLGVVVVSSLILGGYGLILSGSVVAVILSGSQDQDSQTDRQTDGRNA